MESSDTLIQIRKQKLSRTENSEVPYNGRPAELASQQRGIDTE